MGKQKQRVVIYARVSTTEGKQTPEKQLRQLRTYAKARDFTVMGEYDHDAELLKKAKTAIQAAYAFYMDLGYTQYAAYFEKKLSSINQLIEELK